MYYILALKCSGRATWGWLEKKSANILKEGGKYVLNIHSAAKSQMYFLSIYLIYCKGYIFSINLACFENSGLSNAEMIQCYPICKFYAKMAICRINETAIWRFLAKFLSVLGKTKLETHFVWFAVKANRNFSSNQRTTNSSRTRT